VTPLFTCILVYTPRDIHSFSTPSITFILVYPFSTPPGPRLGFMSVDLLKRIERDLCSIGEELWKVDGQDDVLDGVLKEISLLKAQLNVQKSLQPIANLLRRQPMKRALPNQKATKVKRFIRFIFRKGSGEDRYKELRNLDCDVLKFCGLTYTVEELVKLDDAEFDILKRGAADFVRHRNLSSLLYRPDVDKAVESTFEDPDDEDLYDKFLNGTGVEFLQNEPWS
jgi:hypothetical protein